MNDRNPLTNTGPALLATRQPPLSRAVYQSIAEQIARGSLREGSRLPTEREFAATLGVSRTTVRKAIAALKAVGLVQAIQGRGTFVSSRGLVEPPNTLLSFSQLAAARGLQPGASVISSEVRGATLAEADRLRIAPGAKVLDLVRLRTLDGIPVAIQSSVVPISMAPIIANRDWSTESLYAQLAVAGAKPVRSDWTIEAQAAGAEVGKQLGLARDAPVLRVDSVSFAIDERVVEIGWTAYRGDRYQLRTSVIAVSTPEPPVPSSE
ncbi:MAG: GntR family transcriptional regulator [Acidimicrobiia bacterium]